MGNQILDSKADVSEDSFDVISFQGDQLKPSFQALVYSRFLKSLRYGNDYFRLIESKPYFDVYHAYLATILTRENTRVKFAVLSENHDNVLGFSITEPNKLHYCHVQKDYRRQGVAKALCSEPFHVITHLTNVGASIWNNKFPKVQFNPFA